MPARFSQPVADVVMTVAMVAALAIMGRTFAGMGLAMEASAFGTCLFSLAFGLSLIGRGRDGAGRWRLVLCGIVMAFTAAAAIFAPA